MSGLAELERGQRVRITGEHASSGHTGILIKRDVAGPTIKDYDAWFVRYRTTLGNHIVVVGSQYLEAI